jgi:hypothetical protein
MLSCRCCCRCGGYQFRVVSSQPEATQSVPKYHQNQQGSIERCRRHGKVAFRRPHRGGLAMGFNVCLCAFFSFCPPGRLGGIACTVQRALLGLADERRGGRKAPRLAGNLSEGSPQGGTHVFGRAGAHLQDEKVQAVVYFKITTTYRRAPHYIRAYGGSACNPVYPFALYVRRREREMHIDVGRSVALDWRFHDTSIDLSLAALAPTD